MTPKPLEADQGASPGFKSHLGQPWHQLPQLPRNQMLMDGSRNLPTCKLENQKEPELQLTVAKKLYMMQVQGRVFFSSSFKFRLIKICILQGD